MILKFIKNDMKHLLYNRIILLTTLIFSAFSCSSDLDFNQANDFSAQPVFTTNLAYVELKESVLAGNGAGNGAGNVVFNHTSDVDFLDKSFVDENLVKVELNFRFRNSIPRDFIFSVVFLDKNDAPIYNMPPIRVVTSANDFFSPPVIFETNAELDILKNTKKMVFSIVMDPVGPPLTINSTNRIEMSSSATAYFDIK
jgi:hypothetical protein